MIDSLGKQFQTPYKSGHAGACGSVRCCGEQISNAALFEDFKAVFGIYQVSTIPGLLPVCALSLDGDSSSSKAFDVGTLSGF